MGRVFERTERFMLNRSYDAFVFQNFNSKQLGEKIGIDEKKMCMIQPGISWKKFQMKKIEKEPFVLFVGNFNMDKPNIKIKGLEYLLEAYKLFSDEMLRVFVVEQSNKFRNGIVVYIFNRRAHIWFGAAHSEERASYNDVLHWKIIEWAGKSGLKELEIVGANTRDICEFKAKFNPELKLGFCVKKTSSTLVRIAESLYHVGHF